MMAFPRSGLSENIRENLKHSLGDWKWRREKTLIIFRLLEKWAIISLSNIRVLLMSIHSEIISRLGNYTFHRT